MYLDHFGIRELPFSLTPDTRFFLSSPSHREALNLLLVAIRSGEGFTKAVGEVGTGKTLLCRMLLKQLQDPFVTAYLPNPCLSASGVPRAVAEELGLQLPVALPRDRTLRQLTQRLIDLGAAGRRPVLLIDEAQALSDEALEAVRMLTNLETETRKLLQVVLFGQPELDERLAQPCLRQMRQRITFSCRLEPLVRAGTSAYVRDRLRVAGHPDGQAFSDRALEALHRRSGGVPRLVNILAHKSLLAAWGCGDSIVNGSHVERAAADTEAARPHLLGRLRTGAAFFARGAAPRRGDREKRS